MQPVQASFPPELFQRLFESSPVAAAISRLDDARILHVNDAFVALTGYARGELMGNTVTGLGIWVRPEERSAFAAQLVQRRAVPGFVHEIRLKSGEQVHVVASACLVDIGGSDHILGQLVFLRDLDAAHASLRERDARLRLAEQAALFGMWDLDLDSGRLHWSEGLERLFGLAQGGFGGSFDEFLALIHPEDRTRFLGERAALIERGQNTQFDYRIRRADGTVRWLRSRGSPKFDRRGRVVGAYGLAMDVTSEKEREQLLMLQSQIMTNMAEGVALVSASDARIVFANRRYEQMFGYGAGELQGRHISVVNAHSDRDPVAVAEAIMAELRRAGIWRGDVKNRRRDGSEFWSRATVTAFDHADHGPVWVTVQTDVTEARLAKEQSDAARAQLERLSANLRGSIEAERAAIARDVHDQLGSVLTGMRMRLEALAQNRKLDPDATRAGLREIAGIAQAALSASRSICDRLRPSLLDELGLPETCRWSVREWAHASGIRCRVRVREPMALPDPDVATDLYRALQEMLNNVARHAAAGRVEVRLLSSARCVRLRVQDDGRGFNAQARETRGFGLLSLTERASRHGGTLRIRSGQQGTSIAISLPLRGQA